MASTSSNNNAPSSNDECSNVVEGRELLERKMSTLFATLEPFVHKLDEHVMAVRRSQQLLNQELDSLLARLAEIRRNTSDSPGTSLSEEPSIVYPRPYAIPSHDLSLDLEERSRRLLGLKRRLTLVHSILTTVNSRTKKLLLAHNSRLQIGQQAAQLSRSS